MRERRIPFRLAAISLRTAVIAWNGVVRYTLVRDTEPSSSVFLVKSGQLEVREVHREVEDSETGPSHKRVRRRPVALVGQGRIIIMCYIAVYISGISR